VLEKILNRSNVPPEILGNSHLAIADAYYYDGGVINIAEALSRYTSFLTFYPSHPRADYAQYQLGLCYLKQALGPAKDQATTFQAMSAFRKVETDYPGSEFAVAARERADDCRERLAQSERQVGEFYQKRGALPGAIDRYRKVIEDYPKYSRRDEVYYLLAEALAGSDRMLEAVLYYRRVIEEFPRSRYAGNAKEALAAAEEGSGQAAKEPRSKKSESKKPAEIKPGR
jgi:outer membrane protein assembly factor BamD